MNLPDKIFEAIGVSKILVTGPQRSGTTFVAWILSKDLGWRYIDEGVFNVDDIIKFNLLLQMEEKLVIQCPGVLRWINTFVPFGNVFTILMRRNIGQILDSERKRDWRFAAYERGKYSDVAHRKQIDDFMSRPICDIKYEYFDRFQKLSLKIGGKFMELKYPDDVSDHELFVDDEGRSGWTKKQVESGIPWIKVDEEILAQKEEEESK